MSDGRSAEPPAVDTKIGALRAAWAAGDVARALSIAAKFPRLGDEANAIRRAYDAMKHPAMYRQMRRDPDAIISAGLAAIARRYNLEAT